jgi:hypothetical protein
MERDHGDEHIPTQREIDIERCGNECNCTRDSDPSKWCWLHQQMWESEVEHD